MRSTTASQGRKTGTILGGNPRTGMITLLWMTVFALTAITIPAARAQTYTILHTFSGQGDGYQPYAALTMDRAGNLYGTTSEVGHGSGTVFELKHSGSGWVLNTLFSFDGTNGAIPYGGAVFGPDGALYGVTREGGAENLGTVYRLTPQASVCKSSACPWSLTTLHEFTSGTDGRYPYLVTPVFDGAGHLYGTTANGGSNGAGTTFQISRSGGGWTESIIHNFGPDGAGPPTGVIVDQAGNLYGILSSSLGSVFMLNPSAGWSSTILHQFSGGAEGNAPMGSLIMDSAGNLYGTTSSGGSGGGGTVFELSPSLGSWTYTLLYSFSGLDHDGPYAPLTLDAAGNLYGTAVAVDGYGTVFKLTRTESGWTYTTLHDFTRSDGAGPYGGLILDSNGTIYGTAAYGGTLGGVCSGPMGDGCGVVFQITP